VSNDVLYGRDLVGIQRVEPDTEQGGTTLVPPQQGGYPDYPAWLPDGSGFLYVESGNLFYSSSQGTNIRQLTFFVSEFVHQPSVSPDGNYVVFERQSGEFKLLWLMEWDNPTNMWSLAQGRFPDWSRVNPSVPSGTPPTPTPTPTPQPGAPQNERLFLPAVTR
jgi:Tol biopolymer transport system component